MLSHNGMGPKKRNHRNPVQEDLRQRLAEERRPVLGLTGETALSFQD